LLNISVTHEGSTVAIPTATKPIIGLVGGLGSGKSLVAKAFARHGATIVAGDSLGHEALERPEILERIAARWGERVLDTNGIVDRKKMGAVVFASPVERANLELLVFPWIEQRIREELAKALANPAVPFVVLDAAIMLEAGWNNECDRIVYVHAPRAARLERLAAQRGWNAEQLAERETAQLPLSVKASRADIAVDNSGSAENTQQQVDAVVKHWGLKK
jgi:dephospho-CoA kinase